MLGMPAIGDNLKKCAKRLIILMLFRTFTITLAAFLIMQLKNKSSLIVRTLRVFCLYTITKSVESTSTGKPSNHWANISLLKMLVEAAIIILTILAFFAYQIYRKQQYWQSVGVKVPKISYPLGNNPFINYDILTQKVNFVDYAKKQYKEMIEERYYGIYMLGNRALVINDPELMKQFMIKDFDYFVDRVSPDTNRLLSGTGTKTDEAWANQMTQVSAHKWKHIRSTFTPIFTSGKMKAMVPFINETNNRLYKAIEEEVSSGNNEIELKKYFGKFSMDTIASCAFGVDAGSFTNPNSPFVKNAREVFRRGPLDMFKLCFGLLPFGISIMSVLGISMIKPSETEFFYDVVLSTLKQRQEGKYKRNDLIDMMIEAMRQENQKEEFDELTLVATALVMLVAGYDTTGQTLSYCAYELAKNPEIQDRLQAEIDELVEDGMENLEDYNKIQSLEYLDMVLHEALRLHIAVGIISRSCIKDYKFDAANMTIPAGMEVFFNAAGVHADPKYYPNPEQFNPEHFSKEGKANRHPYSFLGFGQGPRNCVGMRFALLEAKMAMALLLSKFRFSCCPKTVDKIELDPRSQLAAPKGDLWIRVDPRQ